MGADLSWLDETGLDTKTGMSYTGGEDKYLSALSRYYKNYGKNRAKVEEFLTAGDMENYMITVHALKSNSKMIGALSLSSQFEELENASRNNDKGSVDEKTGPALNAYEELVGKLAPIADMGDVKTADEISGDVAKDTAQKLLAALDDFDDELAKELAKKLSGYPFRMTQAGKLNEAIGHIEDFMYDEAAELIREIIPAIE